jgi:DNA-binding CsgD family transcriptional regulator
VFAEELAAGLEEDAAAQHRLPYAARLLWKAARLSPAPEDHHRRLGMAAHAAWKSGDLALTAELSTAGGAEPERVLRGLVSFYGGDQDTALGHLRRAAVRAATADTAAELRFMAVGAALNAGRVQEAVAAAQLIADRHDDADYRRYGRWLVAALRDNLDVRPWHVVDAAPAAIGRSAALRWLFPLAISAYGGYPREAREVAAAACAKMAAAGMDAIRTTALGWLADLELRLGRWREATAHAYEGLRLSVDLGQPPSIAGFQALLAQLAALTGDEVRAEEAYESARVSGNRLAAARTTWALGLRDLAAGDYEPARQQLSALTGPGPRQHPRIARLAVADTVEAHVRAGDVDSASAALAACRVNETSPPWVHANVRRSAALLASDDVAFQQALAATDDQTMPFEWARIALAYGQWLRRQRRISAASQPLRQAVDMFDELGAAVWTARATGELRAGNAQRTGRTERAVHTLTDQEQQVARLAAAGLSNREIGAQLQVSHRTVGYHLHKTFRKLGITSRAQLRYAIRSTE